MGRGSDFLSASSDGKMDPWIWMIIVVAVASVIPNCDGWRSSSEEDRQPTRVARKGVHYHKKRHMLPNSKEADPKKRLTSSVRAKDTKKRVPTKSSGHLTPLHMDDIDNDEVVSVAIGPPPMRPTYDKQNWKSRTSRNQTSSSSSGGTASETGAVNIVKDVLTQIGREFLTRQMNEDFVFGQYVGIAMRNITGEQKIRFQHDILELIIKYQKLSRGEVPKSEDRKDPLDIMKETPKYIKTYNDTDETWSDFSNLAKIVG
ncbi:hypothetical protein NE865_00463 [Phthorimaea operculella]|nr:hypothetical protein NE865_00463 [Phthorimaea operculella]